MHILMLHPHDINSTKEPWVVRIRYLAKELIKLGNKVTLVYFPIKICQHCEGSYIIDNGVKAVPLNRNPGPRTLLINIKKLLKLAEDADVIHFQKVHYYCSIPAIIAGYIKNKHIHYDWDDWEEKIWYRSHKNCKAAYLLHVYIMGAFFKLLERFAPLLSDTISVSSQNLRNLVLNLGVKNERICLAHVGADLGKFNPSTDCSEIRKIYNIKDYLVLYVGQLHGAQYVDIFINAANYILHRNHRVNFMIIGEGFMEGYLRGLSLSLGIGDKIIFTGHIPHDKIPEYIAAADVCVAPFEETEVALCKSPLKIAEYMAMGKAIVASNVGEVRNMVGGVGILVKPGDSNSLAEGILKILSDKPLRDNLGNFARLRAEKKYNWSVVSEALLKTYQLHKNEP